MTETLKEKNNGDDDKEENDSRFGRGFQNQIEFQR